jgi:hypothetical protein
MRSRIVVFACAHTRALIAFDPNNTTRIKGHSGGTVSVSCAQNGILRNILPSGGGDVCTEHTHTPVARVHAAGDLLARTE